MSSIIQTDYHKLRCTFCGSANTAELVAFDIGPMLVEGLVDKDKWKVFNYIDLSFYLTLRDLFQEFNYVLDDDGSLLNLTASHIIKQVEYLLGKKLIEVITKNAVFNSVAEKIKILTHDYDEKELKDILIRFFCDLIHENEVNPNKIISSCFINVEFKVDDRGNKIPSRLICEVANNKKINIDRVCPYCGEKYNINAGTRKEYLIGLIGLPRVGKTSYLTSLCYILSEESNKSESICFSGDIDIDEEFTKFNHDYVNLYKKGEMVSKTEISNVNNIPTVHLPLSINDDTYNFVFVDMPGEAFNNNVNDSMIYILNNRDILKYVDEMWLFVNANDINSSVNGRLSNTKEFSTLISLIEKEFNTISTNIILTQCDLLGENIYNDLLLDFDEYVLNGMLNIDRIRRHMDNVRSVIKREIGLERTFDNLYSIYSCCGVSVYKIEDDIYKCCPRNVLLPFMLTLNHLGIISENNTNSFLKNIKDKMFKK